MVELVHISYVHQDLTENPFLPHWYFSPFCPVDKFFTAHDFPGFLLKRIRGTPLVRRPLWPVVDTSQTRTVFWAFRAKGFVGTLRGATGKSWISQIWKRKKNLGETPVTFPGSRSLSIASPQPEILHYDSPIFWFFKRSDPRTSRPLACIKYKSRAHTSLSTTAEKKGCLWHASTPRDIKKDVSSSLFTPKNLGNFRWSKFSHGWV